MKRKETYEQILNFEWENFQKKKRNTRLEEVEEKETSWSTADEDDVKATMEAASTVATRGPDPFIFRFLSISAIKTQIEIVFFRSSDDKWAKSDERAGSRPPAFSFLFFRFPQVHFIFPSAWSFYIFWICHGFPAPSINGI